MALKLIRKNNSDAVEAYHDAAMAYSMLGDGILDGVFNSMNCSLSGKTLTIKSGIACVCGRLVEIEENTEVKVDFSSFSTTRIYIWLRLRISDNDELSFAEIYVSTRGAVSQNEHKFIAHGPGAYSVLFATIFNFAIGVGGTIKPILARNLPLLECGIAKNAKNLLSGGTINGVAFSDIFLSDMSGVYYAKNADVCAEARGFIGGDVNRVDSNLYMPGRGVYLLQEAILVQTTKNIVLGASQTTSSDSSFHFKNQNSLSRLEGVTDFRINGSRQGSANAPAVIQYDYRQRTRTPFKWIFSGKTVEVTVDLASSPKKVIFKNTGTQSITLPPLDVRAYIFGGAA